MVHARFSHLHAVALRLVVCAALLPLRAIAADSANLEGTWRIAAPQSSFKPEGGAIPFTAEGRKRYQENKRDQVKGDFDKFDYATARCASPGLPRLMLTPGRLRIWQRSRVVTISFEWNRLFRQIDTGGLIPQRRVGEGSGPGGRVGDDEALVGRAVPISKGKWDGDTLVATTEGFAGKTLIDDLVPHGYDMKLTERIHLRDQDTLEIRITIEDPEYFTKPWQTVVTYKRQPDEAFPENVCLDSLKLDHWPPSGQPIPGGRGGAGADGPAGAGAQQGGGGGLPTQNADDSIFRLTPGAIARPSLPANAPQPSPDPHNFDGTWFNENALVFYIGSDMFGSPLPFTAEGRKVTQRRADGIKNGTPYINASAYCIPMGQLWQFDLNTPFHVFQSKDRLEVDFEEYHGLITIALDPSEAPPAGYMGRSVARWDGDTLVVETSGFKEDMWLTTRGSSMSKNAKLTHRIRKAKAANNWYLEVIYTIDDPAYYTKPWSIARQYAWHPDMELFREYDCELQTGAKNGMDPSLVPEPVN